MEFLFIAFAFLSQILLILNFAARNWKPVFERRYGWITYAMGVPALILGIVFLLDGQPGSYVFAPFTYAAWAAFGATIDLIRPVSWRSPTRWSVFIPFVLLFMIAQFAFWIPLWSIGIAYWIVYTLMYALNTALNLNSHRRRRKSGNHAID
jgi:hypothetical protein